MTVSEMQRIKRWHQAHQHDHPLECEVWDAVLTLWTMGWMGLLPVLSLEQPLWLPACLLGIALPQLYVAWRQSQHRQCRLRCDWLEDDHKP